MRAGRSAPIATVLVITAAVSVFFTVFGNVDLWFTGLFHDRFKGFSAETDSFLIRLRALGPFIVKLIAFSCVALLALRALRPASPRLVPPRAPLFLLTTLALGPGLIANAILKAHSGRPRPRQVDVFGGDMPYVPIWRFTDHCASNCSFVSGEGSAGAWLLALALVVPRTWRVSTALAAAAVGAALSLNRVAFGGHFLSDTLMAWCLTGLAILLTHRLFYVHTPPFLTDDALDRGLARIGEGLGAGARAIRRRIEALSKAP